MRAPILVAVAIFAGGCGAQELEDELSVQGAPGEPPVVVEGGGEPALVAQDPVPESCDPTREKRLGAASVAYAARARGTVAAYRRPGSQRVRVFQRTNENGVDTVFGLVAVVRDRECRPMWYRAQLPLRPNGAAGYVRADRVRLFTVGTRIEVDLSERRIDFFRDGRRVLRARAAIGKGATPTPVGHYYVNQRVLPPTSRSPSPWGDRDQRVLDRPHRLDAGRPDRHPRHERPILDRHGRLVRLPADREPPPDADAPREPGRHSSRHPRVKATGRKATTRPARACKVTQDFLLTPA